MGEHQHLQPVRVCGAKKIAKIIDSNRNAIPKLVAECGLPAYKELPNGPWIASVAELNAWSVKQSQTHLEKTMSSA